MNVKLPTSLLDAVAKRACVAFVGSGLSAPAGLPTWKQLITHFVDECEKEGLASQSAVLRAQLQKDQLMDAAAFAQSSLGKHRFGQVLRKHLAGPIEPTENHRILVDTPYRAIMTTNYDKLIETAYTLRWKTTPRVIGWSEAESLGSVLYDEQFFVFKLHGDIDNIASVILTRRDYDEIMFRHPHVRTVLQAILLTNTVLFVGYSVRDPDFEMVLAEVSLLFRGTTPLSFALLPADSGVIESLYRERMNIQMIPYDPAHDHAEVTEILQAICGAAAAGCSNAK